MFRAPLAESFLANPPAFVRELISAESMARTGYFDVTRVQRDCALLASAEGRALGTFMSRGLSGIVATQLWHHLYLGGGLCSPACQNRSHRDLQWTAFGSTAREGCKLMRVLRSQS